MRRDAVLHAQAFQHVPGAPERWLRVGRHHEQIDFVLPDVVALEHDGIAQRRLQLAFDVARKASSAKTCART